MFSIIAKLNGIAAVYMVSIFRHLYLFFFLFWMIPEDGGSSATLRRFTYLQDSKPLNLTYLHVQTLLCTVINCLHHKSGAQGSCVNSRLAFS